MIFFLATLITSTIFITDRLEGIWDRTLVAGISTTELLLAHIITQSTVMLVQCAEIVVLAAFIFDTKNHGDNFTVVLLLMMLGFSGMLYGLFISIFCDSHTMANFMATGSFYPMIILCGNNPNRSLSFQSFHLSNFPGIFWPLEGMNIYLQYIAFLLPFTLPSIAVRNILAKGWTIAHASVLAGYGITTIWIVVLLTLCLIGLKVKR
jgi:ABC-type multidrug transport system permease subunit